MNYRQIATITALTACLLARSTRGDVVTITRAAGSNFTANAPVTGTPSLSFDGRFIAFTSAATNLVEGQEDANGKTDVFLYDREQGTSTLLSHSFGLATTSADGASYAPRVSSDGNFVVFASAAHDLLAARVISGAPQLYLYDRRSATTSLVTHVAGAPLMAPGEYGSEYATMSDDARLIVFASHSADLVAGVKKGTTYNDVFLYDRVADRTTLVSHQPTDPLLSAGGESGEGTISADGSTIAFTTWAPAPVSGIEDPNRVDDLFLYDVASGGITLVSHSAGLPRQTGNLRSYGPSIDRHGRFVAYASTSTNLVENQVDTNGESDIFLYDRARDTNTLVSRRPGSPFTTGSRPSFGPMLSSNGEIVVFNGMSPEFHGSTSRDPNVYRYLRSTNSYSIVTHGAGLTIAAEGSSVSFSMSSDGGRIAVNSTADRLVRGQSDQNGLGDCFVCDADAGTCFIASTVPGSSLQTANGHTLSTAISGDGRVTVFSSLATNFSSIDTNAAEDLFLWFMGRGRRRPVLP